MNERVLLVGGDTLPQLAEGLRAAPGNLSVVQNPAGAADGQGVKEHPFIAVVFACPVQAAIQQAASVRANSPQARLIFVVFRTEDVDELRRLLRSFISLGPNWSIVSAGSDTVARVRTQVELAVRQRRHRTNLDRINLTLQQSRSSDALTARKLVISERFLAATVENAPDAIITLSPGREILAWNASATELWQRPSAQALGRDFLQFLDEQSVPVFEAALTGATDSRRLVRVELTAARGTEPVPIEITLTPVCHEESEPIAFSVIARDITDRKRAEQSAQENREMLERLVAERTARLAELVSQLEEFSYTVSHDLRGPLRVMQGYADALLTDYGAQLDATATGYANRIAAAAIRMDRLIQDVLAYSRASTAALVFERIDLNKLMQELVGEVSGAGEESGAVFEVASPLHPVVAHGALLAQVLSNLLSNAVKFVAAGSSPRVRIWTEESDGRVRVYVADNGIGIPELDQKTVFGMFARGHAVKDYEGTGIGLAIVKRSIDRMQGRVGFSSQENVGTTIWIELPAAAN